MKRPAVSPPGSPSPVPSKTKGNDRVTSPIPIPSRAPITRPAAQIRPARMAPARPTPTPRPRRNPPRISHQETSSRASKKHAVKISVSDTDAPLADKAASDVASESEASDEDPSPQNTDDCDYVEPVDSSLRDAPANKTSIDSDIEMKPNRASTTSTKGKKKAATAPTSTSAPTTTDPPVLLTEKQSNHQATMKEDQLRRSRHREPRGPWSMLQLHPYFSEAPLWSVPLRI
ncbi:hypothetical protein HYPSUDRAFT_209693 [Hypholoma sublateritium FD-334 SS-4]|uniref:Uncharacterized protein n=1 Tax=Hypholoma sublateritium (strain FD-334 SS-4) TaxID=945553 RepID=A0A0D2N9B2_HYPSF|nr:hypothetical protein HYPSUDRAFT_209693 [Hypholoma sublateritium FD-334 SS-4]